jgi:hypothetical protein
MYYKHEDMYQKSNPFIAEHPLLGQHILCIPVFCVSMHLPVLSPPI